MKWMIIREGMIKDRIVFKDPYILDESKILITPWSSSIAFLHLGIYLIDLVMKVLPVGCVNGI